MVIRLKNEVVAGEQEGGVLAGEQQLGNERRIDGNGYGTRTAHQPFSSNH